MKRNVGKVDRIIRMLLGISLLYISLFQRDWFSSDIVYFAVLGFGLVNVVTSMFAFCPLYSLANIGTVDSGE